MPGGGGCYAALWPAFLAARPAWSYGVRYSILDFCNDSEMHEVFLICFLEAS